ncbi:MAG: hypothetical protein ABIK73_07205 [candidate division WOR-3 bacterium]
MFRFITTAETVFDTGIKDVLMTQPIASNAMDNSEVGCIICQLLVIYDRNNIALDEVRFVIGMIEFSLDGNEWYDINPMAEQYVQEMREKSSYDGWYMNVDAIYQRNFIIFDNFYTSSDKKLSKSFYFKLYPCRFRFVVTDYVNYTKLTLRCTGYRHIVNIDESND